jgi:hypothetical protein
MIAKIGYGHLYLRQENFSLLMYVSILEERDIKWWTILSVLNQICIYIYLYDVAFS